MNVTFHWAHAALGFAAPQRGSEERPCNSARPACHATPCGARLEGKGNLGHPARTEGPGVKHRGDGPTYSQEEPEARRAGRQLQGSSGKEMCWQMTV